MSLSLPLPAVMYSCANPCTGVTLETDRVAPETDSESDQQLVRRMAGGDRAALGEMFDRHGSAVLGFLVRLVGRREEAEELMQEVFLQAWRSAGTYRPDGASPRNWLFLLARSRGIDRLRSRRSRSQREEAAGLSAYPGGVAAEAPVGLERLQAEERRRRVRAALGSLPEEQRLAIDLAFFSGLTHRQVAERLDAPLGTVKSRILLGMRKLRQHLAG